MQHFNLHNLHKISETKPGAWATIAAGDVETLSELTRHRFHLVDMRGELWILRRAH